MAVIRPATPADLPQIRAINTHYILHTSLTFMQTPPPATAYTAKWHDLSSRGLPYLVAIDETQRTDAGTDLVLGYASLSPFRGHLISYAPTVELSLFVHPDHQSRAIGSRLLHALVELLRAGHVHHRSQETVSDHGGSRATEVVSRVRNVVAVMAVDPESKDGGEALRRWYVRRGFVERGRIEKVGFKRGHWIDTVYLQYMVAE